MFEGNSFTLKGVRSIKRWRTRTNGAAYIYQPAQQVGICIENIVIHIIAQVKVARNRFAPFIRGHIVTRIRSRIVGISICYSETGRDC